MLGGFFGNLHNFCQFLPLLLECCVEIILSTPVTQGISRETENLNAQITYYALIPILLDIGPKKAVQFDGKCNPILKIIHQPNNKL